MTMFETIEAAVQAKPCGTNRVALMVLIAETLSEKYHMHEDSYAFDKPFNPFVAFIHTLVYEHNHGCMHGMHFDADMVNQMYMGANAEYRYDTCVMLQSPAELEYACEQLLSSVDFANACTKSMSALRARVAPREAVRHESAVVGHTTAFA